MDFTLAWRLLAGAADGDSEALRDQFRDREALDAWLLAWQARLLQDTAAGGPTAAGRAAAMRGVNPRIIARNHQVEAALAAATDGDMATFHALLAAVQQPFSDAPSLARYAEPAPAAETAAYQTFCGT